MLPQILIKPLLAIVAIVGIFGFGYYKGATNTEATFKAAEAIQAKANADKLAEILSQTDAKTRALTDELRKAKAASTLPDRRVELSVDFCRMYNAGAGMPGAPCPHPVTVETVAGTTVDNFAACRQNAIWLEECQAICRH